MIDLTKLSRKFLEKQVIPPDTLKIIANYQEILDNLDSNGTILENEKVFVRLAITNWVNFLLYDYDTWEKMGMGIKLYEYVIQESEYLETVFEKINYLAELESVKEIDILNLRIRFSLWDLCENFDTILKNLPVYENDDRAYTKEVWRNTFMNYEKFLKIENEEITSRTLNIGKKKRFTFLSTPEHRQFVKKQINFAKTLFGGISIVGKTFELHDPGSNINRIKVLGSYKFAKIRKEVFRGIYNDFELKERNSLNEKKVFLYDLFALIFHNFPKNEITYGKMKDSKSEQEFRDYKISVVRNITG